MRAFVTALLACSLLTAADDPKPKEGDKDRLRGTWVLTSAWFDGQEIPPGRTTILKFDGNEFMSKNAMREITGTYEIDPSSDPKTLDLNPEKGRKIKAIYELRGDRLTVCHGVGGGPRPAEITANAGSGTALMRFERDK
jgi:uncharacterized protein (TIGR03067 family)